MSLFAGSRPYFVFSTFDTVVRALNEKCAASHIKFNNLGWVRLRVFRLRFVYKRVRFNLALCQM